MNSELQNKYNEIPEKIKITIASSISSEVFTETLSGMRLLLKSQGEVQKQLENNKTTIDFKWSDEIYKVVEFLDAFVESLDVKLINTAPVHGNNSQEIQQKLMKLANNVDYMQVENNRTIKVKIVSNKYKHYDLFSSGYKIYNSTDQFTEFLEFMDIVRTPANTFAANLQKEQRTGAIISYFGILLKNKNYLSPQAQTKVKEIAYQTEVKSLIDEMVQSKQDLVSFVNSKSLETQQQFEEQSVNFEEKNNEINVLAQEQLAITQTAFNNLKSAYEEKLSFEAPISLWNSEAKKRAMNAAYWAFGSLLEIIVIILLSKWFLNQLYAGNFHLSSDIPQYFVPLALISILVYLLRVFINIAISNWHMSSEYSQKAALTTYYLSMLKEGHVSPEEKLLVLPALFSKIDTGLNKYQSDSDDTNIQNLMKALVK